MLKCFFMSKQWALWAWGGLAVLLTSIFIEVSMMVKLNEWYGEMWDMMQLAKPETIGRFWELIILFCWIVFPFVLLRSLSNFLSQHYCFRWRQAMTMAYLPFWQKVDHDVEGASQRMQEDPQRFARVTEQLALGLFRSVLTLIAFIPILWTLSEEVCNKLSNWLTSPAFMDNFDRIPQSLKGLELMAQIPGSLLWFSCLLSFSAIIISYFVGIRLPGLEYNNQKVEARFRKQLVYAEDDKSYADTPTLVELFTGLRRNYFTLFLNYSYFSLWQNFFFQFVVIADLLVIGPGVIYGIILMGTLNRVAHAFGSVSDSLSYFTENWATVTELLSIIKRLREFEVNIGYRFDSSASEYAEIE
ncbi:putative transporter [Endozoicomonas arenosclerae]|uniref:putative transporter n=1 Tax=Endozoicomonas arenosclerae TaxID=1633495 RepID=UPI000782CCF7|nr:putative transporter [Endozoicomonas arenosclerae]